MDIKMKIPVDIKMKTESLPLIGSDDGDAEVSELLLKGELRSIEGGYMLSYRSNMTDNTVAVFDKLVTVNRSGSISSQLVFEEGRSYFGTFSDNRHTLQMNTVTRKVEANMGDQGGCFLIDYSISYGGSMFERNRITYTVVPEDGIVAS
ncbi:MAG: DUF1934 domain-containing protein [Eubacteriales bacterium]|nr:DUF1934 domain-containing protein [Eubacteriales bacterium]MDD4474192.1 DUF1934 domain-containing protein [Eubacteriales bacterium]